ncbi:MAG: chemotaxis protein CheW [Verrucomicrobia bacterium]|nr:chemotaxis protein CheW [Verrucomicrobiota bacterium]
MKTTRIKVKGRIAVYHCVSRIVGAQRLLDDLGKETLVRLLRRLATFCGLEVITYCIMSNHFHVLVRVPAEQNPTDEELVERMKALYGKAKPREAGLLYEAEKGLHEHGRVDADIRERMLARMGDVSEFMKEFKQRFSKWYNIRHQRFGTLWAERFRSVLVEDEPGVLETVSAYIDLNAVRAGLVEDPKDYRHCGYAVAVAGDAKARSGLLSLYAGGSEGASRGRSAAAGAAEAAGAVESEGGRDRGQDARAPFLAGAEAAGGAEEPRKGRVREWKEVGAEYRRRLFVRGGVAGSSGKVALSREQIRRVLKKGGELSVGEVLRLRIRHMTDGVVLGSKGFVDAVWLAHRERFGAKRRSGARPIRGGGASLAGLSALRDLRVEAIS